MQEEEKTVDVGENEEQAQEIDLDAVAPEQSLEEETINVEQTTEDSTQPADASAQPAERTDVQERKASSTTTAKELIKELRN